MELTAVVDRVPLILRESAILTLLVASVLLVTHLSLFRDVAVEGVVRTIRNHASFSRLSKFLQVGLILWLCHAARSLK